MGIGKAVMYTVVAGAIAFGGYEIGKRAGSDNEYKIMNQNGQKSLYSKTLDKSSPISVIDKRMVLGSSMDNLDGYNLLRTKEITEQVMKLYQERAVAPEQQNVAPQAGVSAKNDPSLTDRVKEFGSDVKKSL